MEAAVSLSIVAIVLAVHSSAAFSKAYARDYLVSDETIGNAMMEAIFTEESCLKFREADRKPGLDLVRTIFGYGAVILNAVKDLVYDRDSPL